MAIYLVVLDDTIAHTFPAEGRAGSLQWAAFLCRNGNHKKWVVFQRDFAGKHGTWKFIERGNDQLPPSRAGQYLMSTEKQADA